MAYLTPHEGLTANRGSTDIKSVLRPTRDARGACDFWRVSSGTHQRQKQKTPDCSGAFALEGTSPSKRMSVFAAAFRSSHVVDAGTGVGWVRRIRRAAFVGSAACARPCGHAFFMLRFLARGGAGTNGSRTGRAGRGLVLSRCHERRAEQRRSDKSRDCKFGSHQKCLSVGLQDSSKPRQAIWFRCLTNIVQILYLQRTRSWPPCNSRRLPNIRHVTNTGFAQSNSIGLLDSIHHKRRAKPDRGMCKMFVASLTSPRCSKCEETMSLRIIEPERLGFESQTFECPKCHDTKTLVTPISSAADDSIAAPASTAIPRRTPRPFRTSRDLCSRYRV